MKKPVPANDHALGEVLAEDFTDEDAQDLQQVAEVRTCQVIGDIDARLAPRSVRLLDGSIGKSPLAQVYHNAGVPQGMDGVGGEGVSDGQGVEVRAKTTDPGALVVGLLVAAFVLLGLAWVVPWGSATQQDSFGPVMGQTVTVDSRGTLYLWGATFEINMSTSGSDSGRVSWFDRIEDPENPGALAVARVGIVFVLLGCVAALASFGVVARRERTLAAVPAVAAGLAALGGILFHSALLMDLQPGFVVGAAPVALMAAVAALAATAALTYRRAPAIAPLVAEA